MSIEQVIYTVTGTSPCLMHNPASMRSQGGEMKNAKTVIPTQEAEAQQGLYKNDDGQLYIPSIALRNSLMGAGVGKKIGKQTAWKMIACGAFVIEAECPLVHPKTGKPLTTYSKINVARVVLGAGKTAKGIVRARPQIDQWQTKLVLEIDDDFISPEQVLQLFALAGRMIGILDWRPERKGSYGRYSVSLGGKK